MEQVAQQYIVHKIDMYCNILQYIICTDPFDNTNYNYTGLVENINTRITRVTRVSYRLNPVPRTHPFSSPPLPLLVPVPVSPPPHIVVIKGDAAFSESKQVTVEFGSDHLDSERKGHRDDDEEEYEKDWTLLQRKRNYS